MLPASLTDRRFFEARLASAAVGGTAGATGCEHEMITKRTFTRTLLIGAGLVGSVLATASGASAQGIDWLWGGGETVGGSGREFVRFSPKYSSGQIIVSFGDRRLYYITRPGEAISYPIAIPREQSRWEGITNVSQKRENPSWTPTPTMIAENPRLPRWVPGGHPMNPLGVRALYLGSSTYRIHGTDAPWTIGTAVSKGCIRMYNQDVLDLYPRVKVGAKVTVTWAKFNAGQAISASTYEDEEAQPSRTAAAAKPVKHVRATQKSAAAPKSSAPTATVE
jgi:lipoprotein-anchoring transpeptidase ErfK/SrfK